MFLPIVCRVSCSPSPENLWYFSVEKIEIPCFGHFLVHFEFYANVITNNNVGRMDSRERAGQKLEE